MAILDRIDAARARLERHGEVPDGLVSAAIGASWHRCLEAGLDPTRAPLPPDIDPGAWHDARGAHDRVRRFARREMEALHGQIAGSNFLVAFAAPDGTVLEALADGSFQRPARDRALAPGICWRETLRGTNALGLAVALQRAATVHGAEHFFRDDAGLTCMAAPVRGADGVLAGVLDASTSCHTRQLHTGALLSMAAAQIENALFRDAHRAAVLLAFHNREEFLFTSKAGLLALDEDGHLLGASPQAQTMLHGLPAAGAATADLAFGAVFAGRFGELVGGRAGGEPFALRDRSGAGFVGAVVARPVVPSRDAPGGSTASPVRKVPVHATPARAIPDLEPARQGRPPRDRRGDGARARGGQVSARLIDASGRETMSQRYETDVPLPDNGTIPASGAVVAGRFVAEDPALARAVATASAAARRGWPVLIAGETGSGKEELARIAHRASGRGGRFVPVNCAALPGELVEAELFGYAEGAFTGARRGGSAGLAAEADGGTLFLDEIGDMDGRAQGALLRLLDDWVVRPVGGGASRRLDVLLVAATNVPLDAAVEAGRFRRDLFHRIAVVPVQLPRLEERRDFAAVARAVLERLDPALRLGGDALSVLAGRRWGGNIRELRNLLTRAVLQADAGTIDASLLRTLLETPPGASGVVSVPAGPPAALPGAGSDAPDGVARLDRQMADAIRRTHAACGRSVSETARRLGVSRNRVYRALRAATVRDQWPGGERSGRPA
ncbi:sigma-54-dependent Fis family transcriptional regulator [Rhizosaccharibacter radicis]|uniref:Sigma 54-interacting transcriptional regulator n=1 Tax=Rhizosaccharibacter radicis TaxID=2782605 RepID=A0ABT1VZ09_9PROT|nr:sigma 54-interacting transcriptional regulator [Acetobacteraceae bacterium KSS12]